PQAEQLGYAFQPAQKASDVLKVVSGLVPSGVWLTGVTFERGKVLQIRGTGTNPVAVSNYVRALTKQSRLRDVKLLFANSTDIEGTPAVQFSITAFPKGNVPILETGKKKK
ncbi:MAG TPA: PilN domain-containing protein, partial [Fimbriimonas sp.]|nr:PilN domain-containing protein [Fimbriimonas sp.]